MTQKKKDCKHFNTGFSKQVWLYDGSFYDSEKDARWACFFDAMGIEYEYKNKPYVFRYEHKANYLFVAKNEFFIPTFIVDYKDRHDGHNRTLLIEVVENWTLPRIKWLQNHTTPLLILDELPENSTDACNHYDFEQEEIIYKGMNTGLVKNNFYHIDNDFFGCFFGCPENGKVRLCGADSSYWSKQDDKRCDAALYYAKNMFFETLIERY